MKLLANLTTLQYDEDQCGALQLHHQSKLHICHMVCDKLKTKLIVMHKPIKYSNKPVKYSTFTNLQFIATKSM